MKTLFLLFIGILIGGFYFASSCSDKSKASVRALKTKAEDQLAAFAGEGEVALELMKQQYSEIKERLVRIKTLRRTMTRRVEECEQASKSLREEGNLKMAEHQAKLADRYRDYIARLEEKEPLAEQALKDFSIEYKLFRDEILILKEEIASVQAMGGLSGGLSSDHPLNDRMNTVRELEAKLKTKLDRAESLVEVNELEEDL